MAVNSNFFQYIDIKPQSSTVNSVGDSLPVITGIEYIEAQCLKCSESFL